MRTTVCEKEALEFLLPLLTETPIINENAKAPESRSLRANCSNANAGDAQTKVET